MNPAPRPPSPSARAATQKALRRENPNQLSTRDARILMGLPSDNGTRIDDGQESERVRLESVFANQPGDASENGHSVATLKNGKVPPRPSREARRASASAQDLMDVRVPPFYFTNDTDHAFFNRVPTASSSTGPIHICRDRSR